MAIPICPECGRLLQMSGENKDSRGFCSCGHKIEGRLEISHSSKIEKKKEIGKGILNTKESVNQGFPHDCEKCGHKWAVVANLGPQWSDESDIVLFKCKKCGHVERKTDGNSSN